MPELRDLFITYLAREQFDLDNEKLAAWALDMEEKGDGRTVSNQGGYQSNDIMDPPEVLEPLYNELNNFGNDLCQRIGIAPIVIDNMWVNVNRYRDFNWPHSHNQATVSGVYYVKTPPDCGYIQFQNPTADFENPWTVVGDDNPYTADGWWMPCEEGTVYLFPSHVRHGVQPNQNKTEPRISISFNFLHKCFNDPNFPLKNK